MQENKILKGDLMDLFFSFEGRIGRSQYWVTSILMGLGIVPVFVLVIVLVFSYSTASPLFSFAGNGLGSDMFMPALLIIPIYSILLTMSFSIMTKRYHDRGKSAWWCLLAFIPYIGAIWQTIELGFLKGDDNKNEYGEKI